jgi:hypothetical protein
MSTWRACVLRMVAARGVTVTVGVMVLTNTVPTPLALEYSELLESGE